MISGYKKERYCTDCTRGIINDVRHNRHSIVYSKVVLYYIYKLGIATFIFFNFASILLFLMGFRWDADAGVEKSIFRAGLWVQIIEQTNW